MYPNLIVLPSRVCKIILLRNWDQFLIWDNENNFTHLVTTSNFVCKYLHMAYSTKLWELLT